MLRFLVTGGVGLATVLLAFAVPGAAAAAAPTRFIQAMDQCDPTTFNQMFGPVCARTSPGTTAQTFIQQLTLTKDAPQWRFAQPQVAATSHDVIQVTNTGGELHTFTEVAHFGGGFVPPLNQLTGNTTAAPECGPPPNGAPPSDDNHFLAPGASFTFTEDEVGTHLYQCCVHPWMHEVLTIRP